MRETGRYAINSTTGESVRAFIPQPLPPVPPLELDLLHSLLDRTNQALGRLDGLSTLLPNTEFFLYLYVRKEAVLSSQIEGTQSSLSDLLLFENDAAPGVPIDDVREVSNYVAAMQHGLDRLRGGFPFSLRLICEIHGILLRNGRGGDQTPGEFRRSQNWIGGTRPGNASFVPPPPERLMECLDSFERFFHDERQTLPLMVQLGLIHVQFETIHPFLDGNGRLGRLLITLLLCSRGVLREPLLYLSLYFKTHRATYYDLLQRVRTEGVWEEWLAFFLEGAETMAKQAADTAVELIRLFDADRKRIQGIGRASLSALRVHEYMQKKPLFEIRTAARALDLSVNTVGSALMRLEKLGITREITGRERDRLYVYAQYLKIVSRGTEPIRTA
ncbi:MAG: Fic family protein [Acidobacteriaceae bacterium]|nr:Fic family protein [Acidobacteriaceae bacterium]